APVPYSDVVTVEYFRDAAVHSDRMTVVGVLHHTQSDDVVSRVNPHPGALHAPPPEGPFRQYSLFRVGNDSHVQTKLVTRVDRADSLYLLGQLVAAHRLHRFRLEQTHPIELSIIE